MIVSRLAKVGIGVCGTLLILFVLIVSLATQRLYTPNESEKAARRSISLSTRLSELSTWPPTPDHPLYVLRMVHDRARLLLTKDPQTRTHLQLGFALERLESAKKLLARGYQSLALSTVSKSTIYVFDAVLQSDAVPVSTKERAFLAESIVTQKKELIAMKPLFSDEQKSTIDRLVEELALYEKRFPL